MKPLAFLFLLLLAGCRTPQATPVVIGRYHQIPAAGDTVPTLPEGEIRWHLISYPTGIRNAFPSDAPILRMED